ncbi:MAG TPA: type I-C CRISPR-associated protein Cas5c [Clostridia bacterium]|nr:MAG: CRISPR-associated protein Cas5 [Firmicutes bacterium ADurb.Bin248]HOG00283.1 type I-C CRISPR-associated protein Cas5c [Clostridia bacterium]HOS17921.1 type I-C CRISPR-associated protein Cas5c [Clostridia bacterium]HPK16230.1 type I-C CRISPR-associated protein Cas5c [Clostridia bacterium]
MGYGIRLEAWGPYALFSRPEMKTERASYEVMTPSAARGLIEAVYWHPGLRWVVESIFVRNPIRFTNIRRNEVKAKILASDLRAACEGNNAPLFIDAKEQIQQRAASVLTDVRYIVSAHFEMTDRAKPGDTPEKFYAMAAERLRRGRTFMQPYFGCREFPAHVRLYEGGLPEPCEELRGERDLGHMLFDMDYANPKGIRPVFFHAKLVDGLLDLTDCGVKT